MSTKRTSRTFRQPSPALRAHRASSLLAPCTLSLTPPPPTDQSELGRALGALIALSFMVADVLSFSLPVRVSSLPVYVALVWHVRAHDLGHSTIA